MDRPTDRSTNRPTLLPVAKKDKSTEIVRAPDLVRVSKLKLIKETLKENVEVTKLEDKPKV